MTSEPGGPSPRPEVRLRTARIAVVLGLPLLAGVAGFTVSAFATPADTAGVTPLAGPAQSTAASTAAPLAPDTVITMSATGDVIMGSVPDMMPANDGHGFFDSVAAPLQSDLVMGNLEEALTEDTGTSKCGVNGDGCFQFRLPPAYAGRLKDAGFDVMNLANNHTHDFGPLGYENTKVALAAQGIDYTGDHDQVTIREVNGVTVGIIGFSPYAMHNQVSDIAHGAALVRMADRFVDVVVVQAQMGAEGPDQVNTPYGPEIFYDENRGDVRAFSHAMIDAGADVIIGHSPHVLRGMEFYQGRLIAYSLGNFAGGGKTLSNNGPLGLGGILRVSVKADGSWAGGQFVSTFMDATGVPTVDDYQQSQQLLAELNSADFPGTGVSYGPDGEIIAPDQPQAAEAG